MFQEQVPSILFHSVAVKKKDDLPLTPFQVRPTPTVHLDLAAFHPCIAAQDPLCPLDEPSGKK